MLFLALSSIGFDLLSSEVGFQVKFTLKHNFVDTIFSSVFEACKAIVFLKRANFGFSLSFSLCYVAAIVRNH